MYRSLAGVLAIAFVMVCRADEIEKAEAKVAKAREEHAAALSKIRDDVKKMIEAKEKKEADRKGKADLAVLATLQAEKDALETKGELPKWVDLKVKERITKAGEPLVNALSDLKGVHVQLKDLKKAAEVEKQIEELKKSSGVAGTAPVAPRRKSIVGDYKDNNDRDTSFMADGKCGVYLPAKKMKMFGKWVVKEDKFEIQWDNGAKDIVQFDKNGKDLIGIAISPEKKENPRTYTPLLKK